MGKNPLKFILFIFALPYGLAIRIRNLLYNTGILRSQKFKVPVISVGNLAVGGTGKTPHIEYIIGVLKPRFKVAILSRGYKRKSKGFIIAKSGSSATEIGDEPAQIKNKFPDIIVAVDSNRVNGINRLCEAYPDIDIILLDDAYQHRSVDPGINILLSDYSNLYYKDFLLPYGRLREHRYNMRRADYILVSRSPLDLSAIDRRIIVGEISLLSHQHLYFTSVVYKEPRPVFKDTLEPLCLNKIMETNRSILLITGIAHPEYLYDYVAIYSKNVVHLKFPDHHYFTPKDMERIDAEYQKMPPGNRCVITTEKDAVRLKEISNITEQFDKNVYYLPIGISFLNDDSEEFNKFIYNYVTKDRSNSHIS